MANVRKPVVKPVQPRVLERGFGGVASASEAHSPSPARLLRHEINLAVEQAKARARKFPDVAALESELNLCNQLLSEGRSNDEAQKIYQRIRELQKSIDSVHLLRAQRISGLKELHALRENVGKGIGPEFERLNRELMQQRISSRLIVQARKANVPESVADVFTRQILILESKANQVVASGEKGREKERRKDIEGLQQAISLRVTLITGELGSYGRKTIALAIAKKFREYSRIKSKLAAIPNRSPAKLRFSEPLNALGFEVNSLVRFLREKDPRYFGRLRNRVLSGANGLTVLKDHPAFSVPVKKKR